MAPLFAKFDTTVKRKRGMQMVEKFAKVLAIAVVVLMMASSLALAGDKVDAEVIKIEEGVYTVKGADGKEIEIKEELVKELDLKTGEMVVVYTEEAGPVKVERKEKK
jgi:hypothetical protein